MEIASQWGRRPTAPGLSPTRPYRPEAVGSMSRAHGPGTARRRGGAGCALLLALLAALPAQADDLLVGGAVSLREPLEEIARVFEQRNPGLRVELAFGASSFVATQVRAGAPIDVVVSADARIVDALVADGLVAPDDTSEVALNRLVVLISREARARPRAAEDLLDPALRRIAVPDGAVPVGRYAREWLAARGLLDRLAPRLVRTEHARATLAAVEQGHVDAAIVYVTDARLARSARLAFEVPAAEQPRIVYAAARVRGAGEDAARFLAFLDGPQARGALAAAGFGTP
jgi:molybdate transport system substrate-binding protein